MSCYYDLLTANVNYIGYAGRIGSLIRRYCLHADTVTAVTELCCGTLSLGLCLSDLGYRVTGIDKSENMLKRAMEKALRRAVNVRLLCEDISDFTLPSLQDVFVCPLDGLNHLEGFGKVKDAFKCVRKNIRPGGLFIFDMNTPYKHKIILGDNSFIYDLPGVYCGWQNEFRESDCSVKITLDIFGKMDDNYLRLRESFREYAYPQKRIVKELESNGFELIGCFDGLKMCGPGPRTERILYAARSI